MMLAQSFERGKLASALIALRGDPVDSQLTSLIVDGNRAYESLVSRYKFLIRAMVSQNKYLAVAESDILYAANNGFDKALQRYQWRLGMGFFTYLKRCIPGSIIDYYTSERRQTPAFTDGNDEPFRGIEDGSMVPIDVFGDDDGLDITLEAMNEKYGFSPVQFRVLQLHLGTETGLSSSPEQIAAELGISLEEVEKHIDFIRQLLEAA